MLTEIHFFLFFRAATTGTTDVALLKNFLPQLEEVFRHGAPFLFSNCVELL
jgi:hypothetical protein